MHLVVVGCGRVGSALAVEMDGRGHSVAVIDRDGRALTRRLPEGWGGSAVVGFGYDRDSLAEADIDRAHALVAVTSGDNTNILAARIARETYEVPQVVARIYDPRRAVVYQRLGIPTVATVSWTSDQILRKLLPDKVLPDWTDATGAVELVERPLPDRWAGRRLGDLDEGDRFRVVALTRDGEARLPSTELLGQQGDIVHAMVRRDEVDAFRERLGGPGSGTP